MSQEAKNEITESTPSHGLPTQVTPQGIVYLRSTTPPDVVTCVADFESIKPYLSGKPLARPARRPLPKPKNS